MKARRAENADRIASVAPIGEEEQPNLLGDEISRELDALRRQPPSESRDAEICLFEGALGVARDLPNLRANNLRRDKLSIDIKDAIVNAKTSSYEMLPAVLERVSRLFSLVIDAVCAGLNELVQLGGITYHAVKHYQDFRLYLYNTFNSLGLDDDTCIYIGYVFVDLYAKEQYDLLMVDLSNSLLDLAATLGIPDTAISDFERVVFDFAAHAKQTTGHATTPRPAQPHDAATAPVEPVRPAVAATSGSAELAWPTEQWKGSPEELGRKQHALIAFLRRVWKPFIEDNKVLMTREILKEKDHHAAAALKGYLHRNKLPPDIPILTSDQLTEHLSDRPVSASSLPALNA